VHDADIAGAGIVIVVCDVDDIGSVCGVVVDTGCADGVVGGITDVGWGCVGGCVGCIDSVGFHVVDDVDC